MPGRRSPRTGLLSTLLGADADLDPLVGLEPALPGDDGPAGRAYRHRRIPAYARDQQAGRAEATPPADPPRAHGGSAVDSPALPDDAAVSVVVDADRVEPTVGGHPNHLTYRPAAGDSPDVHVRAREPIPGQQHVTVEIAGYGVVTQAGVR